ncbi:MAG: DNA-methyltransferase, partial [Phycisphaerae bacterium]
MRRNCIIVGDVLDKLRELPEECVQCVVTSPPYWSLREYGVSGQIGLEPTIDEYVAKMVEVFREVRRVLRNDGVCWLNLGDSYMGGGRDAGNSATSAKQLSNYASAATGPLPPQKGLKPKDLCGIPWRVAFALQADGWWLRDAVIWAKPNPMPGSQTDRCTSSYEFVFQLTKSAVYYFDHLAIQEDASSPVPTSGNYPNVGGGKYLGDGQPIHGRQYVATAVSCTARRNKRNVWTIPTQAFPDAHFATYPEQLVEPCVKAGTSEHGACAECGAPWERIVESEQVPTRPGTDTKIEGHTQPEHGNRDPERHIAVTAITGWRPTCKCVTCNDRDLGGDGCTNSYPETQPCVVLDPFMGSGTTGLVARKLGRDYIGIELNPE